MKHISPFLLFLALSFQLLAQPGQLSISRIGLMPALPSPLQMRDWKAVALGYDSLAFNLGKTGQYFPLSRLGTAGEFNYAGNIPIFLDSYVGAADHSNQAEAINILPAIIGASFCGIDKSNQSGMNWVSMARDFYNLKNGQDVYLNSYSTTSGDDWWYDVMPNVYFYQLKDLYPAASPDFIPQFTSVADRWLYCVKQLGGSATPWSIPNMNYRAFNLSTGLPLATGVPEPEAAGSISWLLYNAYLETGNRKYFEGAQQAMDFLSGFSSNPSYELQLSYGTITAARMNAVQGTNYPLQKLLDWCFNRGDLRGWGSIVGSWGGYDVSGLIGEANDAGDDYAFIMNGFQQAAALAPLPKYDKRYARDIAKWILNVSNASRLFYWNALPQAYQDSYSWASANDPAVCIPHESMKQILQGKSPFATGDAINGGWAATNLSLYSGSSVGYLGAVVQSTNIPEILQIDLNKTDCYGENRLPSYLFYNPTTESKIFNFQLPAGSFGVYEALTETVLSAAASGTLQLTIPAGETRLIRLYAAGIIPEVNGARLYAGTNILDYHYQYQYSQDLRVKALSTDHNTILTNTVYTVYCEPGNTATGEQVQFEWYMDDALIAGQNQSQLQLTAPPGPSEHILKVIITGNSQVAQDTLHLHMVLHVPAPPVVNGIEPSSKYTIIGQQSTFTALSVPAPGETLIYAWSASTGSLNQSGGITVSWQAPTTPSVSLLTLKVTNQDSLSTTVFIEILAKDTSLAIREPLIWYPFDKDTKNAVSGHFDASASGVSRTADARGMASLAYAFDSGLDIIYTPNNDSLNFGNAVSLSCWVKCSELGSERFIISHGSWQQRYKLSITPEGFFRWTVKTSTGVADLDGSFPIELNRYYHVTAMYTGYSMELYVDGVFDTFKGFSGIIQSSTKPLTIGRMDNVETQYALRGSVDEVKLWDSEIPLKQVEQLKNEWANPAGVEVEDAITRIYPNPAQNIIHVELKGISKAEHISLLSAEGREIMVSAAHLQNSVLNIEIPKLTSGFYILRIILDSGQSVCRKIMIWQEKG
ncbi:MAG: T9SS type A sorting domain-containing protein [Bacteroidetes bacterium]|nr:T9SS type A sorting domain-containing protein [Bacteroidota bacterium]